MGTPVVEGSQGSYMRNPGNVFGHYQFRSLCLHLAQSQLSFFIVTRAESIDNNPNSPASMQQSDSRRHNGIFRPGTDQEKFINLHFAKQPLYPRLVERIDAPFVQNDLPVSQQDIRGQSILVVGGKTDPVVQQCTRYLFQPFGTVKAVAHGAAAVVVGINLCGRDDGDLGASYPDHNSANIGQNLPMVPDTCTAAGQQEIVLCVDIYQEVTTMFWVQLQNHLQTTSYNHSQPLPNSLFSIGLYIYSASLRL
jgi:hypothetical protein